MPALVLASSSPRRRELLARIGVVPARVASPDIDETPLKGERPRDYVARLAAAKAYAMAHPHVTVWVEAERPAEHEGAMHPWAFGVIRKGIIPRVTVDLPPPGTPPADWQFGAIEPDTFTKRLSPPAVV